MRRHLHANPELSFEEFKTSAYLKTILSTNRSKFSDQWVRTGIVTELGNLKDFELTIGLRADIDALPITETNDISFFK